METIIWIQIVKEIVTKKKKLRRLHHKKMVNEIKKNKLFKRIKNGWWDSQKYYLPSNDITLHYQVSYPPENQSKT